MANLISPRRGESIIDEFGVPTLRFFEYLEGSTTQVNETISNTEIDASTINLSAAALADLNNRIDDIEAQFNIHLVNSDLSNQIEELRALINLKV